MRFVFRSSRLIEKADSTSLLRFEIRQLTDIFTRDHSTFSSTKNNAKHRHSAGTNEGRPSLSYFCVLQELVLEFIRHGQSVAQKIPRRRHGFAHLLHWTVADGGNLVRSKAFDH